MERRLAAILAADVAGYSLLMGRDEEGTVTQLKTFRKTLVDPMIAAHRGRIVKTTGDGILVEFASAVDAARCAVEVQRGVASENVDVPQQARIEFRIGIHVGDIIFDDNDIFGELSAWRRFLNARQYPWSKLKTLRVDATGGPASSFSDEAAFSAAMEASGRPRPKHCPRRLSPKRRRG